MQLLDLCTCTPYQSTCVHVHVLQLCSYLIVMPVVWEIMIAADTRYFRFTLEYGVYIKA